MHVVLDKHRLLKTMTQMGWQLRDLEPLLREVNDDTLKRALELIRDLRTSALHRNVPPVLVRVALKFALQIDSEVIQKTGRNPTLVNHLSDLILQQFLEAMNDGENTPNMG